MKQKEIVLKASRFSVVTAFVLGSVLGLNSCRDEFSDEDQLKMELEALEAAKRRADSLRLVEMQMQLQANLAEIRLKDSIERRKDSLAAIKGKFFYAINVVYGNTAVFTGADANGRTTDVEKLAGATVTVSQLGVKRTVTLGNDGMAVFPGYFVAGEITGSIVKAGFTPVQFKVVLDAPARGAFTGGSSNYMPPVYSASSVIPVFELPAGNANLDPVRFSQISGNFTIESNLTNNTRETLNAAENGVVVTANIDGNGSFFKIFKTAQEAEVISGSGDLLGKGATSEIVELSYSSAVFAASVSGSSYTMVVPASPTNNGLPFRVKFSDVALNQTHYAIDGTLVNNTRAVFGPQTNEVIPAVSSLNYAAVELTQPETGGQGAAIDYVVNAFVDAQGTVIGFNITNGGSFINSLVGDVAGKSFRGDQLPPRFQITINHFNNAPSDPDTGSDGLNEGQGGANFGIPDLILLEREDLTITFGPADANGNVSIASVTLTPGHIGGRRYRRAPEIRITSTATPIVTNFQNLGQVEQIQTHPNIPNRRDIQNNNIQTVQNFNFPQIKLKVSGGSLDKIFIVDGYGDGKEQVSNTSVTFGSGFTEEPLWRMKVGPTTYGINQPVNGASVDVTLNANGSVTVTLVNGGSGFKPDPVDDVDLILIDPITLQEYRNVYHDPNFVNEGVAISTMNSTGYVGHALAKVSRVSDATGYITEVYVPGNSYGKYAIAPTPVVVDINGVDVSTLNRPGYVPASFQVVMGPHPAGDGTLQVDRIVVTASGAGYKTGDQVILKDIVATEAQIVARFEEFPGNISDGQIIPNASIPGGPVFPGQFFSAPVTVSAQAITKTNTSATSYAPSPASATLLAPTIQVDMAGGPLDKTTVDLTQIGAGYNIAPRVTAINNGVNVAFTRYQDQGYTVAQEAQLNNIYYNAAGVIDTTGGTGFTLLDMPTITAAYTTPTPTAAELAIRNIPVFDFEYTSDAGAIAVNPPFTDLTVGIGSPNLPVAIVEIDPVTQQPRLDALNQPIQAFGELVPSTTPTGSSAITVTSGGSYFTIPQILENGQPSPLTPIMTRDQIGGASVVSSVGNLQVTAAPGTTTVYLRIDGAALVPPATQDLILQLNTTAGNDFSLGAPVTSVSVVSTNRGQGFTINALAPFFLAPGYQEHTGGVINNFFSMPGVGANMLGGYSYHQTLANAQNNVLPLGITAEPNANLRFYVSMRITAIPGTTNAATVTTTVNGSIGGIPAEAAAALTVSGAVNYASYNAFAGANFTNANVDNMLIVTSTWQTTGTPNLDAGEILFVHNKTTAAGFSSRNIVSASYGTPLNAPAVGSAGIVLSRKITDVAVFSSGGVDYTGNNFLTTPTITLEGPNQLNAPLGYTPSQAIMTAGAPGQSVKSITIFNKGRYTSDVDGLRLTFTDPNNNTTVRDIIFSASSYKLLNSVLNVVNNGGGYNPNSQVVVSSTFPVIAPATMGTTYSALPFDILPVGGLTGNVETGFVTVNNQGQIPAVPVQTSLTLPPVFNILGSAPVPPVIPGVTDNFTIIKRLERQYLDGINIKVSNVYQPAVLVTNVEVGNAIEAVEIIYGGGPRDNFSFDTKYTAMPHAIFPEKGGQRITGMGVVDANGRIVNVTNIVQPTGYTPVVGDIIRFATFAPTDFNWDNQQKALPVVDVSATAGFGSVILGTDGIEGFNNDGAPIGFRSKVRFSAPPRVEVTAYELVGSSLVERGSGIQVLPIMSAANTGEVVGFNVVNGGQGYDPSYRLRIVMTNESSTTSGGQTTMNTAATLTTTLDANNGKIGDIANVSVKVKGENYLGDGRFRDNKGKGVVDIIFYEGTLSGATDEERMTSLKNWIRNWEHSGNRVAYAAGTPEANNDPFADDRNEGLASVTLVDAGRGYKAGTNVIVLSRKQSILLEAALEGLKVQQFFSNPNDPDTKNEFVWYDDTNEKTKEASFARNAEAVAMIGAGADRGKVMSIVVTEPGKGYFAAPNVNISYRYRGPRYTDGVNGECTIDYTSDTNNNGIIDESEYVTTKPSCIPLGSGATAVATVQGGRVTGIQVTNPGANYGSGAYVQNWQAGSFENARIGGDVALRTGNTYNILTGVKVIRDIFYGTGWRGILKQ